ncbi:MAG TPA: hypothetical protein VFF39_06210 [Verrucomicrobiae bacterium]|nr:hypothetical protein [Verrucomicrobiae bacterium]
MGGAQIPLALLIRKVSSKSVSLAKASSNPLCGEAQVSLCNARTWFIGFSEDLSCIEYLLLQKQLDCQEDFNLR